MTVARRALRETGEDAVGRRRVVAAAETAGLCRTSDRLSKRRTGRMGKALFAVLCTCGHNIRKNRPGPAAHLHRQARPGLLPLPAAQWWKKA